MPDNALSLTSQYKLKPTLLRLLLSECIGTSIDALTFSIPFCVGLSWSIGIATIISPSNSFFDYLESDDSSIHEYLICIPCLFILKKVGDIHLKKVFNFPSNLQVNVAPFSTLEGIFVSLTVKNNDTYLMIVEKRINYSLKPLLLMSSSLIRVHRNNITKQSLLKLNYHSKPNTKKSANSSGNNTTGNSSNSESGSGSDCRYINFNLELYIVQY
ncbi:hypothetical protein ACTFIW_003750 [Dictyostelium discoideum]